MPRSARHHLLLTAAAVLSLSACGGGTASDARSAAPPPATRPAAPQGPALAGKDRMIVAWCERFGAPSPVSGDGKVHVITVEALSVPDGTRLAKQQVTLPERGSVDTLCGQPRTTTAAAARALFNADFTLIAGTAPGPGGDTPGATAFNLAGTPVEAPKPAAAGPDSAPAFQPGTSVLWYATGDRQVTSRDLGTPGSAPASHGAAPGPDFVLAGDQPWLRRPLESKPDQVAVSPDGTTAAGSGPTLWRRTDPASSYAAEYVEPLLIGRPANGRASLPGSERVQYCEPVQWIDDLTLLCNGRDNIHLLVLGADRGRLETTTALLPPDDHRYVESVTLSPDGRSLAYLESEDKHTVLFRLDLAPGAEPSVVGPIGMPPEGVVNPLTPRLIAWL
ncbi:hypothetical protein OG689_33605 [Kitasatospora sp. NBC_00240]|uniref:hypothetical protein n=1 Tax=Kitasatospora sp. NBC_00240 TaxID=2903567 RepID=UPI00225C01D0|nr:hypothetical protein [Kitasatospora sp. NBC_00240]MCX5214141.1 hypothetical protein [Kitasatospora sp. NBC_00240]